MTIDVRGFGPIDSARSTALSVTAPFRSFVGRVVSPVGDTWNGAVHYNDLQLENDRLRAEVARLEGELARLPDVEADLEALMAATDLEFAAGLSQVTARVVSDRRTGIERIVEINRGSVAGIRAGMPVVVGNGLAGFVAQVIDDDRSVIRLITDSRASVGVVGVDTGQTGVASGDGSNSELPLDPLLRIENLTEGERFETTALSLRYPPDIPVGVLVKRADDAAVYLQPFVDFERLGFVTVLLTEDQS